MTQDQINTLADVITFKYRYIARPQAYRMIQYAIDMSHGGGTYGILETLTDMIYIFTGEHTIRVYMLEGIINLGKGR